MTVKAFVLIETAVGKTRDVEAALKVIEGIRSVDRVTGPYDIIAVIEGENLKDIGDFFITKIYPIPGISRTVGCLNNENEGEPT